MGKAGAKARPFCFSGAATLPGRARPASQSTRAVSHELPEEYARRTDGVALLPRRCRHWPVTGLCSAFEPAYLTVAPGGGETRTLLLRSHLILALRSATARCRADVAELVDARDLKSLGLWSYGFDPRRPHHLCLRFSAGQPKARVCALPLLTPRSRPSALPFPSPPQSNPPECRHPRRSRLPRWSAAGRCGRRRPCRAA